MPSREYVLQALADAGVPLRAEELAQRLDVGRSEMEAFSRRLGAMERAGQLLFNRRGAIILPQKADLLRGRVEGHPDGYGFLIPDDGSPDLFLGPHEMRQVLHGDVVMARISGVDRRGRREGRVVEVLERANSRIVGRVVEEHGIRFLVAENRRINQDILIAPGKTRVKAGQVAVVELVQQPGEYTQPLGRVVEILGDYADPGMEIEIALRKHELPFEFSREAAEQTRRLPRTVRKVDLAGREDLRALPLVTIDGETARDFDDAVFCERNGRGYRLVVAIADVSHYVQPASALDRDGCERGNSVYFPRRVIPMLPEKLSNGLCSLNPQVDRLCMACDMAISATGKIRQYRFFPAVMHSRARLTYTQVFQALTDGAPAEGSAVTPELMPHLHNLEALWRVLMKERARRGAIDFETVETVMVFNEQGKIERIVPSERNDAHRIIEECMLAANVCASDFLRKHKHPTLYRIHEGPTAEKLTKLREFLAEFGLHLGGGEEPQAKDYAQLLARIQGRPDTQLLQTVMLRSLQQAVYSPENVGHFGLAYEHYTHFTSPIRRYPDLLVHRAIKGVLEGQRYSPGDWERIGLHCSMTERRADEATRDVEAWLKGYFMQDKVGEVFDGTVSAVTAFGLFVALDEVYVEGLVHISELGADYFHFDPARHQLLGERSGRRFRIGDRLRVQVVRVSLETRRIDFRLDESAEEGAAGGRRRRGGTRDGVRVIGDTPGEAEAPAPGRRSRVARKGS